MVEDSRIVVCETIKEKFVKDWKRLLAQTVDNSWLKFTHELLCCNSHSLMKNFSQKALLLEILGWSKISYAGRLKIFQILKYYLQCSVSSIVFILLRHINQANDATVSKWLFDLLEKKAKFTSNFITLSLKNGKGTLADVIHCLCKAGWSQHFIMPFIICLLNQGWFGAMQ